MRYTETTVLIPSHSLEDFPTDLADPQAISILNAFAVAWHPALLASAKALPGWHRSDEPPEIHGVAEELQGKLLLVPTACEGWLPCGWVEEAANAGLRVISGIADRSDWITAIDQAVEAVEPEEAVDPDLLADFLALGTCHLQVELLSRQMHHFGSMDEGFLYRDAVAAAEAALASDHETARKHLTICFEKLLEARERFYAVDCYLIDLCLVTPQYADKHFRRDLLGRIPVNYLLEGQDLRTIATEQPELVTLLKEACTREVAEVAGGEESETSMPLLPVPSILRNFERGQACFAEILGQAPTTWGRHRFGLSSFLPQVLHRFGYRAALHILLDDGIYPSHEETKIRWEGRDGTVIDAITHIPLPADSAVSYLRFPMRMAEAMQDYQAAAAVVVFARWPEVKSPWFDDFRRMHRYAPVLGRFVTFRDFFEHTETSGPVSSYAAKEYLTPFLTQAVARRQTDPISRFTNHFRRRTQFDVGHWYEALNCVLTSRPIDPNLQSELEDQVEQVGPDRTDEAAATLESTAQQLAEYQTQAAGKLAETLMARAGTQPGFLVLNPLSFPRRVVVDLPDSTPAPLISPPVKAVQCDASRCRAVVDVPASGFAWFPAGSTDSATGNKTTVPLAEGNVLRNELFEVLINEETGGIQRIKEHGRSPNRLSQQLAFRFLRERTIASSDDPEANVEKTYYSVMRCESLSISSTGPAMGEIVTTGRLVDPSNDATLARFQQTCRLWRGQPAVEIDITLNIEKLPDGNPWNNYYASRFAWNDSTAVITRSLLQGAEAIGSERFESPDYIELATEDERTTILTLGLPFHRKTGPRMLDSLLIVEGEQERNFRFVVTLDSDYPQQSALDAMVPPSVIPTSGGPPASGQTGWLFHLDAKNVQLTRLSGLKARPVRRNDPWDEHIEPEPQDSLENGFCVRLQETEGRARNVRLRCFRTPVSARQRDFQGQTVTELTIDGDCIRIEMTAYEIVEVELRF